MYTHSVSECQLRCLTVRVTQASLILFSTKERYNSRKVSSPEIGCSRPAKLPTSTVVARCTDFTVDSKQCEQRPRGTGLLTSTWAPRAILLKKDECLARQQNFYYASFAFASNTATTPTVNIINYERTDQCSPASVRSYATAIQLEYQQKNTHSIVETTRRGDCTGGTGAQTTRSSRPSNKSNDRKSRRRKRTRRRDVACRDASPNARLYYCNGYPAAGPSTHFSHCGRGSRYNPTR